MHRIQSASQWSDNFSGAEANINHGLVSSPRWSQHQTNPVQHIGGKNFDADNLSRGRTFLTLIFM